MPEKLIMVRESVYRELVEALRPFAEVDYEELIGAPDDMPIEEALRKAGQPTVGNLRRAMDAIAKAEATHPAPDGCGREGKQIEAAARAIANAWGETWECCCTEQRGLDCDCGDAMPDGSDGYYERLTRDDCRRAARAALSAITKSEEVL